MSNPAGDMDIKLTPFLDVKSWNIGENKLEQKLSTH